MSTPDPFASYRAKYEPVRTGRRRPTDEPPVVDPFSTYRAKYEEEEADPPALNLSVHTGHGGAAAPARAPLLRPATPEEVEAAPPPVRAAPRAAARDATGVAAAVLRPPTIGAAPEEAPEDDGWLRRIMPRAAGEALENAGNYVRMLQEQGGAVGAARPFSPTPSFRYLTGEQPGEEAPGLLRNRPPMFRHLAGLLGIEGDVVGMPSMSHLEDPAMLARAGERTAAVGRGIQEANPVSERSATMEGAGKYLSAQWLLENGGPSALQLVAQAILAKGAGALAGPTAGAAAFAGSAQPMEAGGAFGDIERALLERGTDPAAARRQAAEAAQSYGVVSSALEALPGKIIADDVGRGALQRLLLGSTSEGGTEALQTVAQALAEYSATGDRAALDNLGEKATDAGVLGGLIGGGVNVAVGARPQRPAPAAAPQQTPEREAPVAQPEPEPAAPQADPFAGYREKYPTNGGRELGGLSRGEVRPKARGEAPPAATVEGQNPEVAAPAEVPRAETPAPSGNSEVAAPEGDARPEIQPRTIPEVSAPEEDARALNPQPQPQPEPEREEARPAADDLTDDDIDALFGSSSSGGDFLAGLDDDAGPQLVQDDDEGEPEFEPEKPKSQAQAAFRRTVAKVKRLNDAQLADEYKDALRNAYRMQADEAAASSVFNRGRLTQAEQRVQAVQNELRTRRLPVPVVEDAWRDVPDKVLPVEVRETAARLRAITDDDALEAEYDRLQRIAERNPGNRRAVEEMGIAQGVMRSRGLIDARDPITGAAASPLRTPGDDAQPGQDAARQDDPARLLGRPKRDTYPVEDVRKALTGSRWTRIEGDELAPATATPEELRAAALAWADTNVATQRFTNEATGWEIEAARSGVKHTLSTSKGDLDTVRSVAALPEILRRAVLVRTEPNRNEAQRVNHPRVHTFLAPVQVGTRRYIAEVKVKERKGKAAVLQGVYYHHNARTLQDIKDPSSAVDSFPVQNRGKSTDAESGPLNGGLPSTPKKVAGSGPEGEGGAQLSPVRSLASAAPAGPAPRISVDPIAGSGQVKPRDQIQRELGRKIGRRIRVGKIRAGGGARAAGVYYSNSTRTVIAYRGDLDTTAHEVAHDIDDAFGLVREWAGTGKPSPFDAELVPAFSAHGSRPADGHPDPEGYVRSEGVAEWLRAWMLNPDAAIAAAPKFAAHFEARVPKPIRDALREYGDDVRRLDGTSATRRTGANIDMWPAEDDVGAKIREAFERDGYAFKTTWLDKLDAQVRDSLAPVLRGIEAAKTMRGVDNLRPSEDPHMLIRLLGGAGEKIDDIFERGPIDADGDRVKGMGGISWLLEPLAREQRTSEELAQEMETVAAYMVSERAIEKAGQIDEEIADEVQQLRDKVEDRYAADRRWLDGQAKRIREAHGQTSRRVDATVARRSAAEAGTRRQHTNETAADFDSVAALARKREEHRLRLRIKKLERRINAGNRAAIEERIERLKAALEKRAARYDRMRAETDEQIRRAGGHSDKVAEWEIARLRKTIDKRRAAGLRRVAAKEGRLRGEAGMRKARSLTGAGAGLASDLDVAQKVVAEVRADAELLARVEEAADRYRQWADATLRYMVGKGRLSQEAYEQIVARNEYYVAMHRVAEEVDPAGHAGARKLGSAKETLQRWKGGARTIDNPYANLLRQTESMVKEADRNEALRAFRDLLTSSRGMHQGEVAPLDTIGSKAEQGDPDTVRIFVDGEAEWWQFEEGIHAALKGWAQTDDNSGLMYALTLPGQVSRYFITHSPDFLVRNVIRDAVHRPMVSRTGGTPWDVVARISDDDVSMFRRAGGGQAGHYRAERRAYHRELQKQVRALSKDRRSIVAMPGQLVEAWENIAGRSEMLGRLAEFRRAYDHAKKELGYGERDAQLYAAYQARDLIDYAVAGTLVRKINRLIPFTNPGVQGFARTVRAVREDPKRVAKAWSMYALVPTLLAYAWAGRDEEEREEYRQLNPYLRDMFWNFKVGPDLWLRIPKSFEAGVLATGVERAIDRLAGNRRAFEGYFGSVQKTFIPVDENAYLGPLRVGIELSANYDFFRERNIVPPYEVGKAVASRKGTGRASRLGKALAELVPGEQDPRMFDHFIRAQFGGAAKLATMASDVGRTDRKGRWGDWLSATTGLTTAGPIYGNDVQAVLQRATYLGKANAPEVKAFRNLVERAQSAKTARERDRLADVVRGRAAALRERFEKMKPTPMEEE